MPKQETIAVLICRLKHGNCYVAARDDEEERRAYLYIFKVLDENGCYSYEGALNADEKVWYEAAKGGSATDAKWLIGNRYDYEYECVDREVVWVP